MNDFDLTSFSFVPTPSLGGENFMRAQYSGCDGPGEVRGGMTWKIKKKMELRVEGRGRMG